MTSDEEFGIWVWKEFHAETQRRKVVWDLGMGRGSHGSLAV